MDILIPYACPITGRRITQYGQDNDVTESVTNQNDSLRDPIIRVNECHVYDCLFCVYNLFYNSVMCPARVGAKRTFFRVAAKAKTTSLMAYVVLYTVRVGHAFAESCSLRAYP
jgi:hypothetical protein